ncbi:MAG: response regulator [Rhodanobacteraceae bacterium]|nr:response regulator [Rhodanobacteraceae bacterium]
MSHGRILVVEDEPKIAALLRDYLVADGFEVEHRERGDGVVAAIRMNAPDLVLLDLMLPGVDGFTICRELRTFSTLPVIMLTARVEEIDRVLGLELGADDYVCKPFGPREVVARVRAQLRRVRLRGADGVPKLDVVLDAERFEVRVRGVCLILTPVEFRLLRVLLEHPGRVHSRNQLLNVIYADHRVVSDRTVDSHIKNLRRKISGSVPGYDPVQSVYGVGYKFDETV